MTGADFGFNDNLRPNKKEEEYLIETVYVQDLLQKTVEMTNNTLLAELKVSLRLHEGDYIDYSTYLGF